MAKEIESKELGCKAYVDNHENYVPLELVSQGPNGSPKMYHCYLIELKQDYEYDISLSNLVLAVRTELDLDDNNLDFSLEVDRGNLTVHMKYVGFIDLTSEQVLLCQRFQLTILRILIDGNLFKLKQTLDEFHARNDLAVMDYLLLPSSRSEKQFIIDWMCVASVLFSNENLHHDKTNCKLPNGEGDIVHTKNGLVCRCFVENSLVCTRHNGYLYYITSTLNGLNANSLLTLTSGKTITYKKHYEIRYGITLHFEQEEFLNGRGVFPVQSPLDKCRSQKQERSNASAELPPELCSIIMSPISATTFYSFSFAPFIMHRIESLLIASSLRKILTDYCIENSIPTIRVPTSKVLEAITTKTCHENFHLESLETLGDSFLKYAACQHLFRTLQDENEGILSARKTEIVCNANLYKLGCSRKLSGFIRNEPFSPKMWIIPGAHSEALNEESLSASVKLFTKGRRKIRSKIVADVVEALIGAFLISGGEVAALLFMDWLGIKVDLISVPYRRNLVKSKKLLNIKYLESLLNYSFRDASLLIESLTHASLRQIPRSYQRLRFLGDSVLDYLVTAHLYHKYPGISPGLLTDIRAASANNDCYAQSAIKVGLQEHILHASQELHRQIVSTVQNFNRNSSGSTFGWDSNNSFPKVLGDVMQSLAGAILVDSGYKHDIVFKSIMPLLEPIVSPQTVELHPVRELEKLCHKEHYQMKEAVIYRGNGTSVITIEVEANGVIHIESCSALDKKTARKLASISLLKSLKDCMPEGPVEKNVPKMPMPPPMHHPTPTIHYPEGKRRKGGK